MIYTLITVAISIILPTLIFFISTFVVFYIISKILEKKLMDEDSANRVFKTIGLISIIGFILNFVFTPEINYIDLPYPASLIILLLISFFAYFIIMRFFKFDKKESVTYAAITSIIINYENLRTIFGIYSSLFYGSLITTGIIIENNLANFLIDDIIPSVNHSSFIILAAGLSVIIFNKIIKKETKNWGLQSQNKIKDFTYKLSVILLVLSLLAAIIIILLAII